MGIFERSKRHMSMIVCNLIFQTKPSTWYLY